ncbi:MAG: hypothetical protein SFV51_09990 [Bryobacteraceae bacterium]|nr:hypothetical protein [Bryobacteraceae bacterium]
MTKKLWLLNLLLVVTIALIGRELREDWRKAREREKKMLSRKVEAAKPPPVPPSPAPAPLQAVGYMDVVQQSLFAKDRNPNVIVDPPPPPAPPPPFPKFYGVMNLGDGPEAIMAEASGRQQRAIRVGGKIGEFTLAAIRTEDMDLGWKDKQFTKRFTELREKENENRQQQQDTSRSSDPPPPPRPVARPAQATPGPAEDMGGGFSACAAGDTSPAGTIVGGKKKVVNATPFGQVCRWEPVQ